MLRNYVLVSISVVWKGSNLSVQLYFVRLSTVVETYSTIFQVPGFRVAQASRTEMGSPAQDGLDLIHLFPLPKSLFCCCCFIQSLIL